MIALLSINTYDKDAYVDRWVEQARSLDRSRWRLQVVKNGPSDVEWHDDGWETIRCANPSTILGYREAIRSTPVPSDVDAVVSVHAKTYLPDLRLLDRMTSLLGGHDAVLIDDWPPFRDLGGGECLFLMAFSARAWAGLSGALTDAEDDVWNEVVMARLIRRLGLDVLRIGGTIRSTQDGLSHCVSDVAGTGMRMYGCEPSAGNMGFGHYARPGGYRSIAVDGRGVVTDGR